MILKMLSIHKRKCIPPKNTDRVVCLDVASSLKRTSSLKTMLFALLCTVSTTGSRGEEEELDDTLNPAKVRMSHEQPNTCKVVVVVADIASKLSEQN